MNFTQTIGIVVGIVGFLLLITFHEAGHFAVAKLLGINVVEFSVGMGPLLTQNEKNGTKYSFRLLPIGGYCALEGEDGVDDEGNLIPSDDPKAFVNAPGWKRLLVLLAGSAVNLIVGFLIFVAVYTVVADGKVGFGRVLEVSLLECRDMFVEIFRFLGGLFNGSSSVEDVSGIVGIVAVVADTASYGLINVFYLIGLLSVNLSIMNMLPIPGLDGGRIFIMFIKWICGGKLSQKAENIINGVGMVFLLILMALLVIKDTSALLR